MDNLIFHNERILPLRQARLSPGQAGLLMGWGVFTTLRIYRSLPFAFERHWARMTRDAARLGVAITQDMETVRRAVIELAHTNHRPEGMARVSFVKNQGGLWAQADDCPPTDLLIFTRALVPWPAAHRLCLEAMGIFSAGHYAGTKILSWVEHSAVLEKAHAQGFDDALLLNEKAHLAECTSANIFLVRGERVLTPPLSSGCLPGVTREILLEITPAAGVHIAEQDLTTEDLTAADEVIISSTTREVTGVGFVSPSWRYVAPGTVTVALAHAFRRHVESYLEQAASECA